MLATKLRNMGRAGGTEKRRRGEKSGLAHSDTASGQDQLGDENENSDKDLSARVQHGLQPLRAPVLVAEIGWEKPKRRSKMG
jgi:hypothetical protein